MAITNAQILTWNRIAEADARTAIEEDFLSEGLQGLEDMTDSDVKDICSSYLKKD